MNSANFCYWLQGYCEICGQLPTPQQWEIIKDHLKLSSTIEKTKDSKTVFCGSKKPKSSCSCGRTEEQQKDCAICKVPIC